MYNFFVFVCLIFLCLFAHFFIGDFVLCHLVSLPSSCGCMCAVDLPVILSGDYIGILDPHQQFFDGSGSHAWTLSRDGPLLLQSARHQLDPFLGLFGCDVTTFSATSGGGFYAGTIFRFPLRTSPSALSDTVYTAARVSTLLENFELDADLNLIFLRSVERVEVYERASGGNTDPVLRYQVQVSKRRCSSLYYTMYGLSLQSARFRLRNDLYCVGWGVKLYSLLQSA